MAGSFEIDMSRFVRRANGNINRLVKAVILDICSRVVEISPVGDAIYWRSPPPPGYVGGRFRANWQHGVGSMPLEIYDTTANVSMARIRSTVPEQAGGKIHWLVNNLEYSIALENGRSWHQAPQGVVSQAIMQFEDHVRRRAAEIR